MKSTKLECEDCELKKDCNIDEEKEACPIKLLISATNQLLGNE